MRAIVQIIDNISDWSGKIVRWLCAIVVLVMVYEVMMRYLFLAPTGWAYETSMMIGATIYFFAWAYVHRRNHHIRVDVLYLRLSPRGRAIIDVIGTLIFFLPLVIVLIVTSIARASYSWTIGEVLDESTWYPPAAPLRIIMALGFILLGLQGLANFTRDFYFLIRGRQYD